MSPLEFAENCLLMRREVAYDALFRGEIPYEPEPDYDKIGLSGLWRAHTGKNGKPFNSWRAHLDEIPVYVDLILESHDEMSRSSEANAATGETVFCFVSDSARKDVTDITASVWQTWERSLFKRGEPLLLDPAQSDCDTSTAKSLVLETAAAVMYAIPFLAEKHTKLSSRDKEVIGKIIVNWGPKFVQEWFDGTILKQWGEINDMDSAEIDKWQKVFTPGVRKHFAFSNINDPMSGLARVKSNMEALSDKAIAEHLGWEVNQVQEVFIPSMRKHFAVNYIANPFAALEKVKANLKLLTDQAIAKYLDWDIEDVIATFTPKSKNRFVVSNISDPMAALVKVRKNLEALTDETIAEYLGWDIEEVLETFRPGLKRNFAIHNINDPFEAFNRVKRNLGALTDEAIAEHLGWSLGAARKTFTNDVKKHIAAGYSDHTDGIRSVQNNLAILSDKNIAERLGWDSDQVQDVFTNTIRRHFASRYTEPLNGISEWVNGNVKIAGKYYTDRTS